MDPVSIIEVSPRDGLQNEDAMVSTADKVRLIELLIDAGARRIEAVSFVHPVKVPQMADAEDVMAALPADEAVTFIGLALNERGAHRAVAAGVDEINMVIAASDGFSRANQGVDARGSIESASRVAGIAAAGDVPMSITISTAFGCPFDGEVPLEQFAEIARAAMSLAPTRLNVADTIGVATPMDVRRRIAAIAGRLEGETELGVHFHNTRNTGYANAFAAYEEGVRVFDASAGGIGGCPFAPRATGNIATDDLVFMFERMGIATGIDLDRIIAAAAFLEGPLGKPVPGLVARAGGFP